MSRKLAEIRYGYFGNLLRHCNLDGPAKSVRARTSEVAENPFFVRIAKFGSWVGEIVSEVGDHAPGTWNQCNSIHCAESRFTWVKR
jgi:hypothetical protein